MIILYLGIDIILIGYLVDKQKKKANPLHNPQFLTILNNPQVPLMLSTVYSAMRVTVFTI